MGSSSESRLLFGCEVVATLHQGRRSTVFRVRRQNGETAILKTASATAAFGRRDELRREQQFLERLAKSGATPGVHGLLAEQGLAGLLLEDVDAPSLKASGVAGSLPLLETLDVSSRLVDALAVLHDHGIVHRDFGSHNVLFNRDSGLLKICDFASASLLAPGGSVSALPLELRESIAYVAPEQTGRTNRRVDQRADYYSLGVTLYELFTGGLPFATDDAVGLVHSHMARLPQRAALQDARIPHHVSRVLSKLLAKDPDERYENLHELKVEIQGCQQTAGGVRSSAFGALSQAPRRLKFAPRLFGRTEQVAEVVRQYQRSLKHGSRTCLITGAGGIGKSTFLNQVALEVRLLEGVFCLGTFEQHETSAPYLTIVRAVRHLGEQLLMMSARDLQCVRDELNAAGHSTSSVLTALCPALELALGSSPAPPALSGTAARVRLENALVSLLSAAARTRAICFCFDDVQWADADSMCVIESLITGCSDLPILFILTSRTDPGDELREVSTRLTSRLHGLVHVDLPSLSVEDVRDLLAEAGIRGPYVPPQLPALVLNRTGGNPFFVRAFVTSLETDGLLRFDADNSASLLSAIRERACTDNVVDLLVDRFASLPSETQSLLKLAACVGRQFDPSVVATVARLPSEAFVPAHEADLVTLIEAGAAEATGKASVSVQFRFIHDRVHHAIMSTLDEPGRCERHRALARALLSRGPGAERNPWLFETVGHWNYVRHLLGSDDQRVQLAELNLEAAGQAMLRAANADALRFAHSGIQTLGESARTQHPELSLRLRVAAAEAAFATASYEDLETISADILDHACPTLETAKILCLQGRAKQAQSRMTEAVELYVRALSELGHAIPLAPTHEQIEAELTSTSSLIAGRRMDTLASLPLCTDANGRMALEVLSRLLFSTFSMVSDLFPIVTCRLMRLSLEIGVVPESANGFTFYGLLLSRDGAISAATRLGELALELAHRFDEPASLSQTYLYAHYQLLHWQTPLSDLAGSFRKAYAYGLNAGSPLNAACSATTLCICRFWSGEPLPQLTDDLETFRRQIATFRQNLVLNWHEIWMQVIANLSSATPEPEKLRGPIYDESERLPLHLDVRDKSALFNLYLAKTLLCYLFDEPRCALDYVQKYEPLLSLFGSGYFAVPALYLDSLCRLACCQDATASEASQLKARVERNLEQLRAWQSFNPTSLDHKVLTIEAELSRMAGNHTLAEQLFDEATRLASNSGAAHEEGMTNELAARYFLSRGERSRSQSCIRVSRRAYLRWGALSKVTALEHHFPQFLPTSPPTAHSTSVAEDCFDALDFVSIQNASRAISSEIRLDRLLARLMTILLETSGAQEGYLLVQDGAAWAVEAAQSAEGAFLPTMQSLPLEAFPASNYAGPVEAVVNYVGRTAKPLVLNDRFAARRFGTDQRLATGSVLCFPLLQQGRLSAICYLSNPLSSHAFTASRLRVLEFLSTQAAISLENARLYEQLEDRVRTRTLELEEKNAQLAAALQRETEIQQQLVLREKLAELGSLTAGIAHQIKNPLNFVVNLSDVSCNLADELGQVLRGSQLEGGEADIVEPLLADIKSAVSKIAEHGRRASSIVTGMALHARTGNTNWQSTDLASLVDQSIELALRATQANALPIQVNRDYAAGVGAIVVVAEDIGQVFVNIVENACYSLKQRAAQLDGWFRATLSVRICDLGERVEISFHDNGVGISPGHVDRVFVPFFTTKPPGDGTGLGLSISNDIVSRGHGGELTVSSVLGEYAAFVVKLPKRRR